MENIESREPSSEESNADIVHMSIEEARNYIAEMLTMNNAEALQASLNEVKSRYDSMRGGVGGEYEFQYYIYLIGELSRALGAKPDLS